jgi:hypothetical protein
MFAVSATDLAGNTAKRQPRLVGRVRGARLRAAIDLRGLPKGKVKVRITATTRSGRKLASARTYHTCVPKRRG